MKIKRVKPKADPIYIMGGFDPAVENRNMSREDAELSWGEADLLADIQRDATGAGQVVSPLRSEVLASDVPSFVRVEPGEILPVQLQPFLGSSHERVRYLGMALGVYVLVMGAAIFSLGVLDNRWDIVFSPCMVLPGLAGLTLVYHLVKNASVLYTGARTTVEIGIDPVKRGQSVPIRVVQHGRLELQSINVRLVCMLKTYEHNRLVRRTIYDALIRSEQNVSLSGAVPWEFRTTIEIPDKARQTGEHDAGAQVMWGIEYRAQPTRLSAIEALYPFHVK